MELPWVNLAVENPPIICSNNQVAVVFSFVSLPESDIVVWKHRHVRRDAKRVRFGRRRVEGSKF